MPRPVTTTRLMPVPQPAPWRGVYDPNRSSNVVESKSAFCVLFEELHRIADGQDRLGRIIRNLAAELFLERHHQLDRVETVRAEVVDEARGFGHLVRLDAKMLHDDLLDPLGNVFTHRFHPRIFSWA